MRSVANSAGRSDQLPIIQDDRHPGGTAMAITQPAASPLIRTAGQQASMLPSAVTALSKSARWPAAHHRLGMVAIVHGPQHAPRHAPHRGRGTAMGLYLYMGNPAQSQNPGALGTRPGGAPEIRNLQGCASRECITLFSASVAAVAEITPSFSSTAIFVLVQLFKILCSNSLRGGSLT
jgi:hypothetical protein